MAVSGNPRMTYRILATSAPPLPAKESSPATSNTAWSEILAAAGPERFRMSVSRLITFWRQSLQIPASTRPEQLSLDTLLEGTLHYGWQADTAYPKPHHYTALRSTVSVVRFRSQACATFGQPGSSDWETALLQSSWAGHPTSIRTDTTLAAPSNCYPPEQDRSWSTEQPTT